jgi:uncharacterized RDD family membrane protein YckC
MENIDIHTTQNVTIEQPVASVGERISATAIDALLMFTYLFAVGIIGSITKTSAVLIILMILIVFYHLVSELMMHGQSIGKKLLKIKVVKIDGTQPSFISYLIRWIFRLVDVLMFFGAISTIVIIISGKGQRLGDIAANTTVISLRDRSLRTQIFTVVPENYSPVYLQVNRLNDSDISVAREVLDFMSASGHSPASNEYAGKTRNALVTKMGIRSDLDSEKFLNTIILDYNFIHSR